MRALLKLEDEIPVYKEKRNKINCSICSVTIKLLDEHKHLFNLELQKEPEESEKFKDLKKKFPELIIDIKKIYCRVCMTEFTIGKLLEFNINQHMNSIEHGNKKRKRSYVNSKNVSSFFTKTKVKKVKTKV